jgi:hypothetical protein
METMSCPLPLTCTTNRKVSSSNPSLAQTSGASKFGLRLQTFVFRLSSIKLCKLSTHLSSDCLQSKLCEMSNGGGLFFG